MERRGFIKFCAASAAALGAPELAADAHAPVSGTCAVQDLESYSRQQMKC
jgi:hypothetical protein